MIDSIPRGPPAIGGILALVLVIGSSPSPAHAQLAHTELAVASGIMLNAPEAFAPCATQHRGLSLGVRGGYRLSPGVILEATIETYGNISPGECFTYLPPPPPSTGPFHEESIWYTGHLEEGFPHVQTGLRVGWIPVKNSGLQLRISGGMERSWDKHLWIPTLGLSSIIGRGALRLLADADLAHYSMSRMHGTGDWFDGQLVSSSLVREQHATLALRIHLGVVIYRE